ncbi:MAG: TIGR03986 family CRISPR-associated RAMP protein [Clostridium sp.]|nr:TIGR03986 family CRISPR-associated RAMP protein [Acetatifactor muris]MCM1527278.1 TIGR03986 family CRISPR-associated RAMP protein [Bacteroides sp.]MCM1563028.1 TIGR03986 family CRISPR-associated RAMP protein [Clostridium sp.]
MAVQYDRNNRKFINPYTFVRTPRDRQTDRSSFEKVYDAPLHTGFLRCRLYVRTPLGIPDSVREQMVEGHKMYPFFSYWEDCLEEGDSEKGRRIPVIPGSSLRGSVRSVFEAATDSCFATLRADTKLSKRVEPKNGETYRPGILKRTAGEWKLYRAHRYLLAADTDPAGEPEGAVDVNYDKYQGLPEDAYVRIFCNGKDGARFARTQGGEDLYFGDEVEFCAEESEGYEKSAARDIRKVADTGQTAPGKKRGIVYIGEIFGKKKRGESIFVPAEEVPDLTGPQLQKAYKGLLETLDIYRNPAINRNRRHSGYRGFKHADREKGIPVWYWVPKADGDEDFTRDVKLSPASIGRVFYDTTLNDLVGERKPCANRKKLCEACALFGMGSEESLGSRIRFTDARAQEGYILKPETLRMLRPPRYSYLPFYTVRKGEVAGSYDEEGVEIAGRKFYWHNERAATDPSVYRDGTQGRMNNIVELVMPGAEFTFEVYYDGITEDQLNKLMWCLNFGENREDGTLCHKLGHGKPLGLGSVKMVIEENAERILGDGRYEWRHERPVEREEAPRLRNREALENVMDFRRFCEGPDRDVAIMYPDVYDENGEEFPRERSSDKAPHMWYKCNKARPSQRNGYDEIETLPDILAEDQALHGYQMRPGSKK